ncbi:MAG TPA: hypothetical protein VGB26_01885 [Nitrospiria bacterium]|jgi:hypothetical protein
MRKWIGLSIVAVFLFLDVLPSLAANIEVDGDFRVRGFYTDNLVDHYDKGTSGTTGCAANSNANCDDEEAYNSMRFLLTTTVTAGIAKGVVTLDYTSQGNTGNLRFGSGGNAGTPVEGDVPFGPADNRFALLQAYIEADLQVAKLSAGRKLNILGHSIVFDDPVDGIFVDVPLGPATLSVSNYKVIDNTSTGVAIGNSGFGAGSDTDVYVGNVAFDPTPELKTNLFIGYIQDRAPNAAYFAPAGTVPSLDWNTILVGLTADANVGPLTVGGEVDFFNGSADLIGGGDVDVEGLNVELFGAMDVGPANVGLTFLYASGDDPTDSDVNINGIDGNYPTGIILTNGGARSLAPKDGTCLSVTGASLGGVPNCIGGAGLLAVKGTGSMSPMERLTLQGDVIWARSAEDRSATINEKDVGVEIDGTAKIQLDENLSFLAGIGYLIAGDFWKTAAGGPSPDDKIVGVLELSFVF